MTKNTFVSGDWNVTCDCCSVKTKASKVKERWDGFIVCAECWEPRQSLDFLKARSDKISVPFTRPIPPLVFTSVSYTISYVDPDWVINNYYTES